MFRASASNHRQHKHLFCRPCYRHALYQYAFALKSSELRTKNVLEYLETRPNTSSKKLRIKTNYTHCTYNFNAKVTDDFFQNPLPADQQLGRQQLTRCGQSVSQHKFVTLQKKGSKTQTKHSHGIFTLRLLTPSTTKYEYWKRHKKKF